MSVIINSAKGVRMANKQKYYAVKKGNKTGIFMSWDECKEAIKGFPIPEYKSFLTEAEAKAFLDEKDIIMENEIKPRLDKGEVVAFVDGSYDETIKAYGSGVYLFVPNGDILEWNQKGNNEKYIDMKNVAGEIIASLMAIDWAWKNEYSVINVFHDYVGVEKWATGEWETNTGLGQFYVKSINAKKEIIKINFIHVKGHSNNKYNNIVDRLARNAVKGKIKEYGNQFNKGYIIDGIDERIVNLLLANIKKETQGFTYEFNNKVWSLSFHKDKLKITLYNDMKMVVQGRPSNLFQLVTTSIVESNIIQEGELLQVLRNAYGISIDKTKINNNFKKLLPTISNTSLPKTIEALLQQSIINLNNPARHDKDFSMYVFPVLRALEGVLKCGLSKCSIPINKGKFDMFKYDEKSKSHVLVTSWKNKINCEKANKLEKCYNHLCNNRHTLFHFGMIIGEGAGDDTLMLKTKAEANEKIKETLRVIDENYICNDN